MKYNDFNPFYERLIEYFHGDFAGKVLFSIVLGGGVLAAHYFTIGNSVFENNGWVLSILITSAMLCLFYATHVFRSLLPQLETQLDSNNNAIFNDAVRHYLSDARFIASGFMFGTVNSVMGIFFGLPEIYNGISEKATILCAYFIVGFICGLAALGIFGVTKCIVIFSKKSTTYFDYTSQDQCGGTQDLGWALIIFSSVTLFIGILISVYISSTAWADKNNLLVIMLYYFWIAFPYLLSIFVLLIPAISINKALKMYKLEKEIQLGQSISNIFNELEETNINADRKSELYNDYEFQINMRRELHQMRTWPFGIGANTTYFFAMASSIFTSVWSVNEWLGNIQDIV